MEACLCDLCSANDFDVVRMDRWNAPDGSHWYPVLTCLCNRCGHVFNNPTLTYSEIKAFYQGQKRESFQVARGESKGLNAADVEHLTSLTGPGNRRRALEIGCYTGYLSNRLIKAGWQVEGLEPNPESAQKARELHGITVHESLFEYYQPKASYDLIFLGGVLEHVRSPTNFLLRINQQLSLQGLAYIRVPRLDDLGYDTAADLFILEHLHNFSAAAMSMLLEKTGFQLLDSHVHKRFPRSFVSIARKIAHCDTPKPFTITSQTDRLRADIQAYSAIVEHQRARLDAIFQALALETPPPRTAVYGVGSHTDMLMQHTLMNQLHITAVIDSNPSKHGELAFGHTVQNPEQLDLSQIDAVVISSRAFQEEIYQRIQHWEQRGVKLIRLYDLTQSRYAHE
ncbi:class I SAM-dependent methyltransferase [Marinobacter xestospongiae]|uniref:Class I SAM-dependent methyltransferase n=1 Tax=Marinobacter xestospongiae TaxID=994319 RepID=A0ABU3W188_9GAMM|nr:class I SAM-dependent methyltransferase [Marinobacter xestospongiae]MDV2079967.1 class I SAM-dependent methyltransferase [Marinobacter xestospongiae]